ncbi:hypothetical protein Pmani_012438 [Petrolisthes manimaculis]|uniref:Uncharacterized protein n=1 Tax=Petrolisthes manimaculis TaxID=1843537 RepID=A0AAE1PXZ7_9EUCA|nr:hypothetical protein Pmani_012438 [Petrolisthes manimaculis]
MGFFGSFLSNKVADLTAQVVGITRQDTQTASTDTTTQNITNPSQQHLDTEKTSLNQIESHKSNARENTTATTTNQNINTPAQKPTSLNLPQMGRNQNTSCNIRQDDTEGEKQTKMGEARQGSTGSQENKRKLARQSVESDETVIALTNSEEMNDNHMTDEMDGDIKPVNELESKKQNGKHGSKEEKQESTTDKRDPAKDSDNQETDTRSIHTDTKRDGRQVSDKKGDKSAEEGKENAEGKDDKEETKKKEGKGFFSNFMSATKASLIRAKSLGKETKATGAEVEAGEVGC